MDWNQLFQIVVAFVMVFLGVVLLPGQPIAGACLLLYGLLVGLEVFDSVGPDLSAHEDQLAITRIVLLLVAVIDILIL